MGNLLNICTMDTTSSQTATASSVSKNTASATSNDVGGSTLVRADSSYMYYDQMDTANQKMLDTFISKGSSGFIEAITKEMKEQKMSYAEMRARYG